MGRSSANTVRRHGLRIRHLVILAVIIYLGFTFITQQLKINELKRQQLEIRTKIENLVIEGGQLRTEITNLNTPEYIEELARKELGLTKPGEILYKRIIDPHHMNSDQEQSEEGN